MTEDIWKVVPCQYPRCNSVARFDIYMQDQSEHILVCNRCKFIVHANLDSYGSFFSPETKRAEMEKRPSSKPHVKASVPLVPDDWKKQAAKKADQNARILEEDGR